MYSKKYCFEKIEQFRGLNHTYDDMEGRVCYPAYLKVGERGWILYEIEDEYPNYPHRLNTSPVKNVQYTYDIFGTDVIEIVITTANTRLTLKVIE
jgi:hypothetical protein